MLRTKSRYYLLFLFALLTACGPAAATPSPTLSPTIVPSTETPTTEPPLVFLLAPEGTDSELLAQLSGILQSYATEGGLHFEQTAALDPANLPASLAAVVALAPAANLAELAAAAPQASFVAVAYDPGADLPNLHSLSLSAPSSEAAAFLAGYVAAISTNDWRVGVLYAAGEEVLANAFIAGAEYFCGSCVPQSPPLEGYPLAQAADPANWQGAADSLINLGVSTYYLSPSLEIPDLIQYLVNWNAMLIGQGAPPSGVEGNWLASVNAGATTDLGQQLRAVLSGQAGGEPSLGLSQVNVTGLSPGRQAYIQVVIADLESGAIRLPSQP